MKESHRIRLSAQHRCGAQTIVAFVDYGNFGPNKNVILVSLRKTVWTRGTLWTRPHIQKVVGLLPEK